MSTIDRAHINLYHIYVIIVNLAPQNSKIMGRLMGFFSELLLLLAQTATFSSIILFERKLKIQPRMGIVGAFLGTFVLFILRLSLYH